MKLSGRMTKAMTVCLSTNGVNVHRSDAPPTRLLVGTIEGVARLDRAAPNAPWRLSGVFLEGQPVSAMMIEPGQGQLFVGVNGGALQCSEDEGGRFDTVDFGEAGEYVYSLRYAGAAGAVTLYAGTQPAALYRSDDAGQSWRKLPALAEIPGAERWTFPEPPRQAHVKTIAVDPRDADVIYVGVEQGALLKTTDGGATWRELDGFYRPEDPVYKDIHQVVLKPGAPDEVFMTSGAGLYHSPDGGEHWTHRYGRDQAMAYPDQFIVSPLDSATIFMSGAARTPRYWRDDHSAAGSIMTSHDGGLTWANAGRGLPSGNHCNFEAMSVAAYPGGFSLFAGDTDGAVWGSDDGGVNWSRIAEALAPISKPAHYQHIGAPAPRLRDAAQAL